MARRSSRVLASDTGLSFRQRAMRGKRSAMPDLWRGARLDAFEGDLEHVLGADGADGAVAFERVLLHPGRDLAELGVGEAGVGLGEGDELVPVAARRR